MAGGEEVDDVNEQPMRVCYACHGRIDESDPTAVLAAELVAAPATCSQGLVEGRDVEFHARCYRASDASFRRLASRVPHRGRAG